MKQTAGLAIDGLDDAAVSRVRRVLYLNGMRGADLDDGVQDVRLRAIERPPDNAASLPAWAAVVATHLAIDRGRARRRRDEVVDRLRVVADDSVDPIDVALRESMAQALRQLAPELRAVVVLRFYADVSIDEIARELQVPAGTVKSRLHRAVAALRKTLPSEED